MKAITTNDLKSRGVSILETALENQDEAVISVRGKPRFVVMDMDIHLNRDALVVSVGCVPRTTHHTLACLWCVERTLQHCPTLGHFREIISLLR